MNCLSCNVQWPYYSVKQTAYVISNLVAYVTI
jgi:hypothetical protein